MAYSDDAAEQVVKIALEGTEMAARITGEGAKQVAILLYAVLKVIFIKPEYAALGTLLFSVDFMHITTSRIATLEPFSVFFILLMYIVLAVP